MAVPASESGTKSGRIYDRIITAATIMDICDPVLITVVIKITNLIMHHEQNPPTTTCK